MDNIELLNGIKREFSNLEYKDNNNLDRLKRRLRMLIVNIVGQDSSYYNELPALLYNPTVSYSNMPESRRIEAWNFGKSRTINLIDTMIEELEYFPENIESSVVSQKQEPSDYSKIFIVHGHDNGAKNEVARFVERLGFKAVILHEQVDSGATIIEKLEKHTDVGFAIVLYTACDVGGVIKSKPEDLKPRARQNVIFEHGLLIGKIGRANVVALVKGHVEIPNDISGVVYKSMDTDGAWKYSIAREMKSSGYDVDMNKID